MLSHPWTIVKNLFFLGKKMVENSYSHFNDFIILMIKKPYFYLIKAFSWLNKIGFVETQITFGVGLCMGKTKLIALKSFFFLIIKLS